MAITAPATKRPWWRRARFAAVRSLRGVLQLSDSPHRIAIGSAAGLFVMPLPLPGQMLLGPLLARLVGGNLVASIPWTWLNNPFTVLFFIYGQYRLGALIAPGSGEILSFAGLADLVEHFQRLPWSEALEHGMEVFNGILLPLVLGSGIAASVCAVVGYFAIHHLVVRGQAQKKARHAVWRRGGSSGDNGVDAGPGFVR